MAQAQRSAVATRASKLGVRCRAGFEAADGDDLIPWPDSDGEGAGATAQDNVGAVVAAGEVGPHRHDGPRRGGWRGARLAARWAAGR